QCDSAAERRPDDDRRAQPAPLHVTLDEAHEVRHAVARARLRAAAEPRQVGRVDAMVARDPLEVEPPFDVAGRSKTVDEHDRCPVATVGLMDAQRADVDKARVEAVPWSASRFDHCRGIVRAGDGSPVTSAPDSNLERRSPLITVTPPGPMARQPPLSQTAALRSSMPSSVTPGSSRCADSIQRSPNVSKCGSTAVLGTAPRASAGRRLKRFGQLARTRLWLQSAIAPAEEPASDAPPRHASNIASQTREPWSTCATRPGSPPTR